MARTTSAPWIYGVVVSRKWITESAWSFPLDPANINWTVNVDVPPTVIFEESIDYAKTRGAKDAHGQGFDVWPHGSVNHAARVVTGF